MVDAKTRGTILPATDFNAENVVSRLRKAMRGIGTDEKIIIDILTGHSNSQRQIIKKKYKTIYGRTLNDDIKAELGGHFEDVCIALLTPLAEYIVDCLYYAIKGLRTDEKCVIEVLVSLESMAAYFVTMDPRGLSSLIEAFLHQLNWHFELEQLNAANERHY
ncbi:hypothetical protein TNCV_3895601 [Trichonephila clavipes]|nr:hypothetical protein TNCV_3895601 [Trichonephila clavipes]